MPWLRACAVVDVPPGEAFVVDVDPPVALFNVDGEFFAVADTCTHEKASLADGYIEGDQVECSWHFAKFSLRTGRALSLPATQDLRTFAVRTEDGAVYVEV